MYKFTLGELLICLAAIIALVSLLKDRYNRLYGGKK